MLLETHSYCASHNGRKLPKNSRLAAQYCLVPRPPLWHRIARYFTEDQEQLHRPHADGIEDA